MRKRPTTVPLKQSSGRVELPRVGWISAIGAFYVFKIEENSVPRDFWDSSAGPPPLGNLTSARGLGNQGLGVSTEPEF
jgi:hypothetical protein